jgi:uncharacterized protein
MGLKEQLDADLKSAMKDKDALKLSVVRMLKSAVKYREIELMKPLDDAGVQGVIGSEIKRRRDSVEQYRQGGREELAAKEEAEIAVIESFLPQQMDEAAAKAAIQAAIAETGAASVKDMGKVMAVLRAKHAATMDLGKAGPLVKAALGG